MLQVVEDESIILVYGMIALTTTELNKYVTPVADLPALQNVSPERVGVGLHIRREIGDGKWQARAYERLLTDQNSYSLAYLGLGRQEVLMYRSM